MQWYKFINVDISISCCDSCLIKYDGADGATEEIFSSFDVLKCIEAKFGKILGVCRSIFQLQTQTMWSSLRRVQKSWNWTVHGRWTKNNDLTLTKNMKVGDGTFWFKKVPFQNYTLKLLLIVIEINMSSYIFNIYLVLKFVLQYFMVSW